MATPAPAPPPHDDLATRAFWAALNPDLHIGDAAFLAAQPPLAFAPATRDALAGQLVHEGYVQEPAAWGLDLDRLAAAVRDLSARGLLPVFALVYDEFWAILHALDGWYRGLLGDDYRVLPDFWVWNVDPAKGDAGWGPHRDRGHAALLPDRAPKALSTWIPLSAATPLNSCMYVVPASSDPTYGTPRDTDWVFDYAAIRALPAAPGDVLMWTQALLHWGGRSSPRGAETRVSIAFECQRGGEPAFNAPLLEPLAMLDFDTRLALIAKQILQYRHMVGIHRDMLAFAERVVGAGSGARAD